MKTDLTALVCGIIFAIGLCLSHMINPAVVIGFLDITGEWDPSLLFVMLGALMVSGICFRFILKCSKPVCAAQFSLPNTSTLDRRLIVGSILFGIGWGLAGICPGPAVAALALNIPKALTFFIAMFLGMGLFQITQPR